MGGGGLNTGSMESSSSNERLGRPYRNPPGLVAVVRGLRANGAGNSQAGARAVPSAGRSGALWEGRAVSAGSVKMAASSPALPAGP